jgi:hypothetical protein
MQSVLEPLLAEQFARTQSPEHAAIVQRLIGEKKPDKT